MSTFRVRRGCPRGIVWLLCAALLLPIAQTATAWHVLSRACADKVATLAHGKLQSHPSHCDFCLTAAGLTSSVGGGAPAAPPPPASLHEAPSAHSTCVAIAVAAWGYRSRAPPLA